MRRGTPMHPGVPVDISPEDYERNVVEWLRATGHKLAEFRVIHQAKRSGASGTYTFDAVAEFTVFDGARITVLIECKRHADRIKRDHLLALEAKLRDVGAHKAMMFSTAGYQRGALDYAAERGIATAVFIDGRLTYETMSAGPPAEPPPWANIPEFVGWFVSVRGKSIHGSMFDTTRSGPLDAWLSGTQED